LPLAGWLTLPRILEKNRYSSQRLLAHADPSSQVVSTGRTLSCLRLRELCGRRSREASDDRQIAARSSRIYDTRRKKRRATLTQTSVGLDPAGELAFGPAGFAPSVDPDVVRRLHDVGDVSLGVSLKKKEKKRRAGLSRNPLCHW